MVIEAELPDGTVLEFPDETPTSVVQSRVKRFLSGNSGPQSNTPSAPPGPTSGAALAGGESGFERLFMERIGVQRDPSGQLEILPGDPNLIERTTGFDPGRIVTSGATEIARGLITLPFDVAEFLGSQTAGEIATSIRKNIPKVRGRNMTEKIGSVLIQFGVPAAGAMQIAGAAVKARGATKGIQTISEFLAGGGADFLVTGVEEGTLGTLIENLTGISTGTEVTENTSALGVRTKVMAEAVVLPIAAIPVVGAGLGIFRFGRSLLAPEGAARAAVTKTLKEAAEATGTIPEAVRGIDETLKTAAGTPFQPTTGTTGNIGLTQIEKGVVTKGSTGAPMSVRAEANRGAVASQLEDVVGSVQGNPRNAEDFIMGEINASREAAKSGVDDALTNLKAAENETANTISQYIDINGGKQSSASLVLDDVVTSQLNQMTKTKNGFYKAIDRNRTVPIVDEPVIETLRKIMT